MRWPGSQSSAVLGAVVIVFLIGAFLALMAFFFRQFEHGALWTAALIAGAIALWELGWERPKRTRKRHALLAARQEAPGTQALLSEHGDPHWTDRLPRPLAAIARVAPVTLAVLLLVAASAILNAFLQRF